MRGVTGGVFGPTGPCPLLPTGAPTGPSGVGPPRGPQMLSRGLWLKATTGTAYVAGTSGACTTGAGMPVSATGPIQFFDFSGVPARVPHVLVPPGTEVRWLLA